MKSNSSEHPPVLYSQDAPHYSTLNFFTDKNKLQLLLPFKIRLLGTQPQSHPTGSATPLGKQVSRCGTPADHGQDSRQVLWEPEPFAEQISGAWDTAQPVIESDGKSEGSRLQLSPSHKPDDVGQETKPQILHLRTTSMTTSSTRSEKSNHQHAQQTPAPFSAPP